MKPRSGQPQQPKKRPPSGRPSPGTPKGHPPARPKNPPQPQRPVPRRNQAPEADPRRLFMPKYPCVESMCENCPFHPSGKGYARDHDEFPDILRSIEMGLPFFCHQTVIFDERTTFSEDDEDGMFPAPEPPIQPHFRSCLGAVLYKQGRIELKVITQ